MENAVEFFSLKVKKKTDNSNEAMFQRLSWHFTLPCNDMTTSIILLKKNIYELVV